MFWSVYFFTPVTGRSKGYAFIEYSHTDEAEKAYHVRFVVGLFLTWGRLLFCSLSLSFSFPLSLSLSLFL